MAYTQLEQQVDSLIADALLAQGYAIVRIKFSDGEKNRTLQIMAERTSDKMLNLDDCTQINRLVSDILDVEDIIASEYNLEISSPGIDRPLVRREDFDLYKDNLIKLTVQSAIDGRRRFKGTLLGIAEDVITVKPIDENLENVEIHYENIDAAKLVFTDELLKKMNDN